MDVHCFQGDKHVHTHVAVATANDFSQHFWHLHGEKANFEQVSHACSHRPHDAANVMLTGQTGDSSGWTDVRANGRSQSSDLLVDS